ncbi:hypothetical protein BC792_105117 [Sphingobacterium allocomposti]|uniref:Uncharacterized protein n=1 Tax=Sphingobacterium allocomposti TaxID=415956 RepID=A0A5S5DNL0_9SPHI|nr:hypothetical protein [Sphingobacterium composti Yoo et al. 2007 non Ten et al. 2007]TYP96626.1 hypothetical protein BC792_105117 [Sphingobacterium composti Yoo et al. 2007 non Ten et al. 2007]
MNRYLTLKLLFCCVLIIQYACSGSAEEPKPQIPDPQGNNRIVVASSKGQPGIGPSDALPHGTPLSLPEGIRIVERRHHPFDPDLQKLYAHVNFFYVDVNLVNDRMPGTPPVTVEFPPGLVVVSMDHDKQNGISVSKYLVQVPPTERFGGGRDTTTIYIGMACINADRSMPWYDNQGEEMRYPIARNNFRDFLVTSDKNLMQFIDILKDYPKLRITQHWDPVAAHEPDYVTPPWMRIYNTIQDLIWQITDGEGIEQRDIDDLKKLLEAYR